MLPPGFTGGTTVSLHSIWHCAVAFATFLSELNVKSKFSSSVVLVVGESLLQKLLNKIYKC